MSPGVLGRVGLLACAAMVAHRWACMSHPHASVRALPPERLLCSSLPIQVHERRQQVSQIVEEVQRVVHHLTAEISHQDLRFQAVPYSDTYNGNIKVSRSHLLSKHHPGSQVHGWAGLGAAGVTQLRVPVILCVLQVLLVFATYTQTPELLCLVSPPSEALRSQMA